MAKNTTKAGSHRGPEGKLPVPEECALYVSGDCTFPTQGIEGCYFFPFFEEYRKGHDQASELFRATTLQGMEALRDSITKLFKEIEGNGGDGIKSRVVAMEKDNESLHRERKIMIRILAGLLGAAILIGSGTLTMMWVQVRGLAALDQKVTTHMKMAGTNGQEASNER